MQNDSSSTGLTTNAFKVTERIKITPSRRQDGRPAPLIIRFSPGGGAPADAPASESDGVRW